MFNELVRNHLPGQAGEPVDDTLPHLLLAKLEQPYNAEAFAEITAQTPRAQTRPPFKLPPGHLRRTLETTL